MCVHIVALYCICIVQVRFLSDFAVKMVRFVKFKVRLYLLGTLLIIILKRSLDSTYWSFLGLAFCIARAAKKLYPF